MLTLKIGTRSFEVSRSPLREAERMFKLSPVRRAHRLERAKTQLARAGGQKGIGGLERGGAARNAVAIILSQGYGDLIARDALRCRKAQTIADTHLAST
jgi:hypothetical protein